jgi:hypothetical protein
MMVLNLFDKNNNLMQVMKFSILFLAFFMLNTNIYSQKSTVIINKEHAGYVRIAGTHLKFAPPKNYVESSRFNGYENPLANASIMWFKVPGSLNDNIIAFKRNKDVSKGMVTVGEEMFKINGYPAFLQSGIQFAYGESYLRYIFAIGNDEVTYVLNASWVKDADYEIEGKRIREALLSVIFMSTQNVNLLEAFDFQVEYKLCNLKPGNILMNSMVFTEDGLIPSKTEAKAAFLVNQSKIPKGINQDDYMKRVLESYPIEYSDKHKITPKPVLINGLKGLEVDAIGRNTNLKQAELIYIVLLFDDTIVYQMTGTCLKNYEENLGCFKKMAASFERK